MKSKNIKDGHEISTCKRFLSLYNNKDNKSLNSIRQGDPQNKEPDCICGEDLAIELVGVYDNKYQAEKMWSTARNKTVSRQPDLQLLTLKNLENEIGKKLQKLNLGNYNGFSGKLILVCNLLSPLIDSEEVEQYIKNYVPFRSDGHFDKYFYEIWISWQPNGETNWKIKKLK
ncbi:hypothetical protein HZC27_01805 [Candidatus Roizmanbacteria bacterium]|nr:hypothetical protein [Candidatus Roizmanbacteria bacterium]